MDILRRIRGAVCPLLLVAAAAAQTAWRIPPRGAVEYERSGRASSSEQAANPRAAAAASLGAPLPQRYLHRLAPAPWICQGELAPDQRSLQGQVGDLRDVLRALVSDLGQGRSARGRFERMVPWGDVEVRGTWSAPDTAGVESLRAALRARPPARAPGEPKEVAARLGAFCVAGAEGQLVATRRVDTERGLVLAFGGTFDLIVEEGERAWRRVEISDSWRLVAVRENQDFDFRKRVAAAITAGAGWVRSAVEADESFLTDRRGDRNYGSGRLALALLTMLHGHVPADDPVVQRGFAALRKRRPDDAYSLAAGLMAFAALRARGTLAERDPATVTKWLEQLLLCHDTRVDPQELLRFNYTQGPRTDTSLQQYGLLGMRAAQACGVEVSKHAFRAAAGPLLAAQATDGEGLSLALSNHAQVEAAAGGDRAPEARVERARGRGFAYQSPEDPPFGSMTSAGVSGLLLARAGLLSQRSDDRALGRAVDAAVRDGFAWLAQHFSVRLNPGDPERADNHQAYWLYCLERCCELSGTALLHGRDWYYEGGLQLLSAQQPNGSFRASHDDTLLLDSTCFAVLFLAKASAQGPITGR